MIEIKKMDSLVPLSELKREYVDQAAAPLDGMWLLGFVPMASHFGFYEHNKLIGFCCINSDGYLLQFYLGSAHKRQSSDLFTLIVEQNSSVLGRVRGAFVSTAEPMYFSHCLDNYTRFDVNALMYEMTPEMSQSKIEALDMGCATKKQLVQFVEFAKVSIGAPEEWVTGYYTNLIERNELFGYWKGNQLVASGECRLFDEYQTEYADLGMVVSPSERGKGLATKVLTFLMLYARQKGLIPICSTEMNNIGAQKAICKAGLIARHRIVQFKYLNEN